ncbi:MAG: patatin-like phospholipase family protein [Pseudomonadota bacterium]
MRYESIAIALCVALCAAPAAAQPAAVDAGRAASAGRPRIGLVLSGGGARGFAHIGVLKVLQELRVPVDAVAATSMGAIVGGAYAAGYSPRELEELARSTDWNNIFSLRAPREFVHFRRKEDDYKNLSNVEFGIKADGLTLPRGAVGSQNLGLFLRAIGGPVKEINDLAKLPIPFAAAATDLATGKLVVLQKNVSLSTAMRASMSVPAAFAPVEVDGRPLADGGLVRNLPVDVARKMGVDRVIAVNVGRPLLPKEQLTSVFAVTEQVINILTEQNVERSLAELAPDDILITPDLASFGPGDFARNEAIVAAGEAAARNLADRLAPLALDAAAYAAFEQRRTAPVREDRPVAVTDVQVAGLRTVNPEAIRREIDIPLDRPLATAEIDRAVQEVFGRGDFESVSYSLVDDGPRRTLIVTPYEKSWGYNALRIGGNLQTDFDTDSTFNLLIAHTWSWLNSYGAEWRNEVQIGDTQRLLTELYQPLAPGSRWFVLPRLAGQREDFDLFVGDAPLARFRNSTARADIALGFALPRLGSLRVGVGRAQIETTRLIGPPVLPAARSLVTAGSADLRLDTLDTVNYPRRGFFANVSYLRYNVPAGSAQARDAWTVEALKPVTVGRYTVALAARGGVAPQEGAFRLGGLFNLSGTPTGQLSGARFALVRAQAYRNISDAFGDIAMPVFVGFSLEAGDAIARRQTLRWSEFAHAGSLFFGAESLIGPVYFALGRTFGGSRAVYFFWGRPQ